MARGLCGACYNRHRYHGTLGRFSKTRTGVIVKTVPRGTYRYLWDPEHPLAHTDHYVAEHRKVAWDTGKLTDPADHVHHINGDQLDNRPENLEVLTCGEHRQRHAQEDGTTNQYGTFAARPVVCEVDGCESPTKTRQWCVKHYTRWLRNGDPLQKYQEAGTSPWRL